MSGAFTRGSDLRSAKFDRSENRLAFFFAAAATAAPTFTRLAAFRRQLETKVVQGRRSSPTLRALAYASLSVQSLKNRASGSGRE